MTNLKIKKNKKENYKSDAEIKKTKDKETETKTKDIWIRKSNSNVDKSNYKTNEESENTCWQLNVIECVPKELKCLEDNTKQLKDNIKKIKSLKKI